MKSSTIDTRGIGDCGDALGWEGTTHVEQVPFHARLLDQQGVPPAGRAALLRADWLIRTITSALKAEKFL